MEWPINTNGLKFLFGGSRPHRRYVNGKRTDAVATNDQGMPLNDISVTVADDHGMSNVVVRVPGTVPQLGITAEVAFNGLRIQTYQTREGRGFTILADGVAPASAGRHSEISA